MKQWRILARHKWVGGAVITESVKVDSDDSYRRFTATIRGFRNWRIWSGPVRKVVIGDIGSRVIAIRDRIDANDESIFSEPGAW